MQRIQGEFILYIEVLVVGVCLTREIMLTPCLGKIHFLDGETGVTSPGH